MESFDIRKKSDVVLSAPSPFAHLSQAPPFFFAQVRIILLRENNGAVKRLLKAHLGRFVGGRERERKMEGEGENFGISSDGNTTVVPFCHQQCSCSVLEIIICVCHTEHPTCNSIGFLTTCVKGAVSDRMFLRVFDAAPHPTLSLSGSFLDI